MSNLIMTGPHTRLRTLFESSLLKVLDYRCAGWDEGEEEVPEAYEIVLPRAGAYQRRDMHGTFLADPTQVLFFNRGEPYKTSHPVQGGDVSTVFALHPSILIEMVRVYDPDIEDDPQRVFRHSHLTIDCHLHILQYSLLHGTHRTLEVEEKIMLLMGEIIAALYRGRQDRRGSSTPKTAQAHGEQVQAVKTFLNANLRSHLGVEQISAAVHLSPYHLCRIFKKYTGLTLHKYLRRLQLFNAAERMLEHPGTRLDVLALDYGFSNHGSFSTAFRETFGLSPSQLRGAHLRRMSKIL
jgi:AraC-like DNA-binding protein